MTLALLVIAAFLAGSIPFGYVIGIVFFKTDIRKSGSGNIGAMNAMRTIGKDGAVAVLLLDAVKGFAPPPICAVPQLTQFWMISSEPSSHPSRKPGASVFEKLPMLTACWPFANA